MSILHAVARRHEVCKVLRTESRGLRCMSTRGGELCIVLGPAARYGSRVFSVIAARGMDAVSFRSVAAAGVSVGRVQHHFGSRDALIRAGCVAMLEGAERLHEEHAGSSNSHDQLHHAVAHVIPTTNRERRGRLIWFAYVAKSLEDPLIARSLAEAKQGQEQEVAHLLQGLNHPTPLSRARELIALADGLAVRVLIDDLTSAEALAMLP